MFRIIIFLITFLTANHVLACSCNLASIDERFNEAESVFLGKVYSIIAQGESNQFGDERIIVTFNVKQPFKNANELIILDTFDNGVSCEGYWFKEGHEYLVYAYKTEGRLSTFICGGVLLKDTKKGSVFLKELKQLKTYE